MFPQLKGLGQSYASVHYGLAGAAEATDYLRDPVLGDRLVQAATAVRSHLTRTPPLRLIVLMGTMVDTLKLISCMTLFRHVASTASAPEAAARFAAMAGHAEAILAAAAAQGYSPCRYTEEALRRRGG